MCQALLWYKTDRNPCPHAVYVPVTPIKVTTWRKRLFSNFFRLSLGCWAALYTLLGLTFCGMNSELLLCAAGKEVVCTQTGLFTPVVFPINSCEPLGVSPEQAGKIPELCHQEAKGDGRFLSYIQSGQILIAGPTTPSLCPYGQVT